MSLVLYWYVKIIFNVDLSNTMLILQLMSFLNMISIFSMSYEGICKSSNV